MRSIKLLIFAAASAVVLHYVVLWGRLSVGQSLLLTVILLMLSLWRWLHILDLAEKVRLSLFAVAALGLVAAAFYICGFVLEVAAALAYYATFLGVNVMAIWDNRHRFSW